MEDFDYLLEVYKRRKADYVKNDLEEKMVLHKLIVMDDVDCLAKVQYNLCLHFSHYRPY